MQQLGLIRSHVSQGLDRSVHGVDDRLGVDGKPDKARALGKLRRWPHSPTSPRLVFCHREQLCHRIPTWESHEFDWICDDNLRSGSPVMDDLFGVLMPLFYEGVEVHQTNISNGSHRL